MILNIMAHSNIVISPNPTYERGINTTGGKHGHTCDIVDKTGIYIHRSSILQNFNTQ